MIQVTSLEQLETFIDQNEEVVVRKNHKNNVVVISMEEYNERKMRKDIVKKLKESEEEIEKKEGIEADIAFKELRKKYEY